MLRETNRFFKEQQPVYGKENITSNVGKLIDVGSNSESLKAKKYSA